MAVKTAAVTEAINVKIPCAKDEAPRISNALGIARFGLAWRTGDGTVAEEARSEKFGDSEAIILPELPQIAALLCRTDFIKHDVE
jgi:hypothetical protein